MVAESRVSVWLAKEFESIALALSNIEDALQNAGELAASLRQNSADLADSDKITDTALLNRAETSQKAAAHVIAGDIDHQMEQMAILKQD